MEYERKQLYEGYKLQWMLYHGFSLTNLMECLEFIICEDVETGGSCSSLQDRFEAWEFGVGFDGGQISPCYEDDLENEYLVSENRTIPEMFRVEN